MGGIPAGGARPPPPARLSSRAAGDATGTSSSAVKSIVAACSVVAPCCSITASRVRAARRWSPHQSVWLRCVSRTVGYLRCARRPSTSVAVAHRSFRPAQQLKESAAYGGCVAAHRASNAGHRVPLAARDRGQRGAKPSCRQPCCRLRITGGSTAGRASGAAECQRYTRSSVNAAVARCKALSSTRYRGTITPRVRLFHQQALQQRQQRFTQEQHAIDAP